MQRDGCECGRISSDFLAGTPKTIGHAGTKNVGTNRAELNESYFVQAHAQVEVSLGKFCKPRFGHACLVLGKRDKRMGWDRMG